MTKIVLGTMNICYPFSSNKNIDEYEKILLEYEKVFGVNSVIDTAYYYGNGKTEAVLGEIFEKHPTIDPLIASKVNPWFDNDFTTGKLGQLSKEGIYNQFNTSLKNLKKTKIETLFLHCPDYETPIEETMEVINELWRKEKINNWGLSNYSSNQLANILEVCNNEVYELPIYYQGMYNPICRKVEELFPLLDDHSIEFWGYNPLAGGLLTSKYKNKEESNKNNRFNNNAIYHNIFWKQNIIEGLNKYYPENVEKSIDLTFSWLINHSYINNKFNKIVLGVSSVKQLNQNLNSIYNGKTLTNEELLNLNSLYEQIKFDSPNYYY